jgi:hypothetical protein
LEEFLDILNAFPNGEKFIFDLEKGLRVKAEIETMYETDNGLEMEEEDYEEYFACALKILSIELNEINSAIKEGILIEVSKFYKPSKITLISGKLVWLDKESL